MRIVAITAAALICAGCTNHTAAPTATSSAAASTTTAAATTAQYASVVAKHAEDVRAGSDGMSGCDPVAPDEMCKLSADRAQGGAQGLVDDLGGLPPAPAEITKLVSDTLDAARLAATKPDPGAASWVDFDSAVSVLVRQLSAWAPYGV